MEELTPTKGRLIRKILLAFAVGIVGFCLYAAYTVYQIFFASPTLYLTI